MQHARTNRVHEERAFLTIDAMIEGVAQTEERSIRPESRSIDKVVAFGDDVPTFFGFLRPDMANRSVVFEIYSSRPRALELRTCIAKAVELEIEEYRQPAEEVPDHRRRAPLLVIVSTGCPRSALGEAEVLMMEQEGVHRTRLPFGVDVVLIDIKTVDATGAGGYKVLGHTNYLTSKGIHALVCDPEISDIEKERFREMIMRYDETHGTDHTSQTYWSIKEEGREEGRQEGREEGQRQALLEMAVLLLGSTDGLDQLDDLDGLRDEIRRRHERQQRTG